MGVALAALAVAAGVGAAVMPAAPADTAIWVHGALKNPAPDVARRIPPEHTFQEVDFAGGLWPWTGLTSMTGGEAIEVAVPRLNDMIDASVARNQGDVLVIGESEGAMIVDQQLRNMAGRPGAPDSSQVRFQVIADPTRPGGLLSYLPVGSPLLLTFTRQQPVPETPYDVTVIKLQYDGIASFPDRPWHLLSTLNAVLGALLYHGTDHYGYAAEQVMKGLVPPENIRTETNRAGGVTTTYTVPTNPAFTHLLEPYFPEAVAAVNKVITPLINLGYSELTPDAGPHLAPGGTLVNRDGTPVFGPAGKRPPRPRPTAALPAPAQQRDTAGSASASTGRSARQAATGLRRQSRSASAAR